MKRLVTVLGSLLLIAATILQTDLSARQSKKNKNKAPAASLEQKVSAKQKPCCPSPMYACADVVGSLRQTIPPGDTQALIFNNNVLPPLGISHPVAGEYSQFQVHESGLYSIQWQLGLTTPADPTAATAIVAIRNVGMNALIPSSVEIESFPSGSFRISTISGQTLVHLEAGAILQLEISAFDNTLLTSVAGLTIIKIADS